MRIIESDDNSIQFRELHHDHDMRDHRTQPYKSSQSDRCQKAS